MRISLFLILVASVAGGAGAAQPVEGVLAQPAVHELPVEVESIEVEKIWDGAADSAFADLLRREEKFYCALSIAGDPASMGGRIQVLSSATGKDWRPEALLAISGFDLREAQLAMTPDGRLMLRGAAMRKRDGQDVPTGTFVSFLNDGGEWSKPELVVRPGCQMGRITWYGEIAYAFRYSGGEGDGISLLASDDGVNWRAHAANVGHDGIPTDLQLRFDSCGNAYALVHRNAASALLLKSSGDLRRWSTYDLDRSHQWAKPFAGGTAFEDFGGPNFRETFDGIWIAAGRMHEGGTHTALTWLDVDAGEMRRLVRLPGSGGTGFHGMTWHDGTLYVSYSSRNAEKVQVFIAKVTLRLVPQHYTPVCKDAGAGGYEAFPDVCRLTDGRLLCVFYAGLGHVNFASKRHPLGGRIAGCFSEDEGKTWGDPVVVIDGPMDDRDPSVTQLSDGRLFCVYFQYPKGGVWLVESTDAAATWGSPRRVASNDYYVSSPIRELSDARLVLGFYREGGGSANGAVTFSDDGGKTWEEPVQIDNAGVRLDAETDLIELAGGSLYALQRAKMGTPAHWSRSKDRGATWTRSEPVGFQAHAPYLHEAANGTILLGYRMLGEQGTIGNAVRASDDGCRTWSDPVLVDRGGGYTSMVNLK